MRRVLHLLTLIALLGAGAPRTSAFALLGAFDTWQVPLIGYNIGIGSADLGGPMNLGEEYRLNVPYITYGFDESFLNYFGTNGVVEVEKAIALLSNVGAVSKLSPNLTEFPLDTRRFNYQAGALGLFDLKSFTLSLLLEQLGVAPPERWTFCLRAYVPPGNPPPAFFTTIMRNFDPFTFEPSRYVNGTLYTYQIVQWTTDPIFDAVEY